MITLLILAVLALPVAADDADVKAVVALLSGSYSSEAQSKKDEAFFDVRLEMTPIWTENAKEHWLYVEQAMATSLDKPYRQRVYKVEMKDGAPVSRVFTLPGDVLKYAGAHKDAKKLEGLKPEQLLERGGCAIVLKKTKDGYTGATVGKGCMTDLKGSYATSEVVLAEKLLTCWDRGYDANGKQVWGAVKGPYEFVKK